MKLFSKIKRDIKALILFIFLIVIPMAIFLSPIGFSFYYSNPWFMLLFVVSWIPAVVLAMFVSTFIE